MLRRLLLLRTEDYLSAGHQCLPRPRQGALQLVFKDGRTSIRVAAVVGGGGSSLAAAAAARGQDLKSFLFSIDHRGAQKMNFFLL